MLKHRRHVALPVEEAAGVQLGVAVVLLLRQDLCGCSDGSTGEVVEGAGEGRGGGGRGGALAAGSRKVAVHGEAAEDLEVAEGEVRGRREGQEAILLNPHLELWAPGSLRTETVAELPALEAPGALQVEPPPSSPHQPRHADVAPTLVLVPCPLGVVLVEEGRETHVLVPHDRVAHEKEVFALEALAGRGGGEANKGASVQAVRVCPVLEGVPGPFL
eukprot:753378-Hanusia_phi.AAC.2